MVTWTTREAPALESRVPESGSSVLFPCPAAARPADDGVDSPYHLFALNSSMITTAASS